jgi:lipid-A-disaccharide synthase
MHSLAPMAESAFLSQAPPHCPAPPHSSAGRRVFITVAEVSGDMHAAQLIHSLHQLDPTLQIEGLGGPAMRGAGATIHHETVGNAAMGAAGVLRIFEMLGLLRWTRQYFRDHPPDLQICCDSPAMNFHFAKLARRRGIPVLYYIAPQLWAWREGRMRKLRRSVDHVACILPFEEAYFRGHGVPASYVGHPLFDELPERSATQPAPPGAAAGVDAPLAAPLVGLLPGSRRGEAAGNFPPMLQVAERIRAAFPAARFVVPTTAATHPLVQQLGADIAHLQVQQDAFDQMVPRCDLCITVSGTATLHVAGHGVPMLVVYRLNPLLWHGVGRWMMRTRTFALVNLLANTHLVREFIPWFGDPVPVADAAIDLLRHPAKLAEQRERLANLVRTLDRRGASLNVARLALQLMDGPLAQPFAEINAPTRTCA